VQIHLYIGDIDRASILCDRVLNVLSKIENSSAPDAKQASHLMKEAVIILVEVLYTKGSAEAARTWGTKTSMNVLRGKANPFMKIKRNETGDDNEDKYRRILRDAVSCGNFATALYMLSTVKITLLKFNAWDFTGQENDYLQLALKADSLATISLLLEYRSNLEDYSESSRLGHTVEKDQWKRLRAQRHLFAAIEYDSLTATDLLLRSGTEVNAAIELSHFSHDSGIYTETLYEFYEFQRPKVVISPLGLAISNGQRKMSEMLVRRGANVNVNGLIEPPLNTAIRCI
jgi:hypothetical protein